MAMVPTETGALETQRSPVKTRRMGVTAAQKQALIENLQLEITERARKLRSNYNIHAQSLRTRIEIRVNRIPMSLRKMKMGDLLDKYSNQQKRPPVAGYLKGPPVPEKDPNPSKVYPPRAGGLGYAPTAGPPKRRSHEMTGGDKENEIDAIANPKKRPRAEQSSQTNPVSRSQNNVLSPTSSNTRTIPRNNPTTTPGNTIRSGIARPTTAVSPTKGTTATSHSLNNTINRPPPSVSRPGTSASVRKTNLSSSTSTSASSTVKRKRAATAAAPAPAPAKPGTRTGQQRRVSGTSESSEGSTSTVVRKRPATAPGERPPISKGMSGGGGAGKKSAVGVTAGSGSVKKGVAPTTTAAAAKRTVGKAGTTGSAAGRVLRKRA
ncbi:Borealin N terminal-domain-containing protein [Apiosordaria backusii]|uniref:Borealin N terminal-domain-containing protein n=1 Tax=Apiosordaria backusii TaxID=314023 RepID=A0AA40AMX7_9PEZI|nr:Borealin N terminal-domain-containing protein [Apiosordaria backusii]